jgi:hypothetical protein
LLGDATAVQVDLDWITQTARVTLDGGAPTGALLPGGWAPGQVRLTVLAWDNCRCTATLLEPSCIPAAASPLQPARSVGSSASGSSKGRHAAATSASASQLSFPRSPAWSFCPDELSLISLCAYLL